MLETFGELHAVRQRLAGLDRRGYILNRDAVRQLEAAEATGATTAPAIAAGDAEPAGAVGAGRESSEERAVASVLDECSNLRPERREFSRRNKFGDCGVGDDALRHVGHAGDADDADHELGIVERVELCQPELAGFDRLEIGLGDGQGDLDGVGIGDDEADLPDGHRVARRDVDHANDAGTRSDNDEAVHALDHCRQAVWSSSSNPSGGTLLSGQ